MTAARMHADEVETNEPLVRRLLNAQFPAWAELPIKRVESAGTDNALYRLGSNMVVRLPRIHWAVDAIEKEQRWLPLIARHLPLAVPSPIAKGTAGEGYPWDWSIYSWLDGKNAAIASINDLKQAGVDIAGFIVALRGIDPTDGPRPKRPARLAMYDSVTRAAISQLENEIDGRLARRVWDAALEAHEWDGRPTWVHSDLDPGNVLIRSGRISAVIDWGSLHIGDPARDMKIAWSLLSGESRDVFRDRVGADDATWARGRGMVLAEALQNLLYYNIHSNPVIVRMAYHKISQLTVDQSDRDRG